MSNKLSVTVSVDQRAALLEGRVLPATATIEIERAELGDYWSDFVSKAQINLDGTATANFVVVSDLTPEAMRAWYSEQTATKEREAQEQRHKLAIGIIKVQTDLDIVRKAFNGPMLPAQVRAPEPYQDFLVLGFQRPLPFWSDSPGYTLLETYGTPEQKQLIELFLSQHKAIVEMNAAEVGNANSKAIEDALPELAIKFQQQKEASQKADLEAKENRARFYARRLETGFWEKETSSYNEKRHSAPWVASVSFPNGAKPVYAFGTSTANWGSSGLLRIECKPGHIIAWGQKDLRHPSKSVHNLLYMRIDGSMEDIDKTEAYKRWTAAQTPATV